MTNRIKQFWQTNYAERAQEWRVLADNLERCGLHDPELERFRQDAAELLRVSDEAECRGK